MKTAYDFISGCFFKPGNEHFIIHCKLLGLQNKVAEKIVLHSSKKLLYEIALNSKFNSINSSNINITRLVEHPWHMIQVLDRLRVMDENYLKYSNTEWIFKRNNEGSFVKTEEKAISMLEEHMKNGGNRFSFDHLSDVFTKIIKTKSFYDYIANCYANNDLHLSWKVAKRLTTKKFEKDLLSLIFSVKSIESGAKGKLIAEFIKRNKIENMDSLIEELQKNKNATKK